MRTNWIITKHLPEILEIENSSFEFPWSYDDFVYKLRSKNIIGMNALDENEEIFGYVFYELFKNDIQILSLAVKESKRRKKIGSFLIDSLKYRLSSSKKRDSIFTNVRESNLDSQLFFKSQGFLAVDILKEYHDEELTSEPAYRMQYNEI